LCPVSSIFVARVQALLYIKYITTAKYYEFQ
jgi:hypothetical protein